MKIRYATATGIYDEDDWDGPPPMPYDKVVNLEDIEELTNTLQEYLAMGSQDGKVERQALRKELKRLIS